MATNKSSDHNTQGHYKPEYWDAMKSQLDQEMPIRLVQKPYFKRSMLAMGIGIGLSMGWFIWSNDTPITDDIAINNRVTENITAEQATNPTVDQADAIPEEQNSAEEEFISSQQLAEEDRMVSNEKPKELLGSDENDEQLASSESNITEPSYEPVAENSSTDELELPLSKESQDLSAINVDVQSDWNLSAIELQSMNSRELMDAQQSADKKVSAPNVGDYSNHRNPFALRDVQVFAIGGVNLSNGYSNTENDGSFSADYLLGLGIQKQIGIKTSFRFSAQYMQRSGHELEQTKEIITYFLDRYVTLENIHTEKMQFLHFPIELKYRMGYRHNISSGIFVSYLLNAQGERTIYYEDSQSETELETSKANGYIGGFAPLSYGLSLGYEYSITSYINAGMRYNFGLNDLTLNDEFKNSNFDRINEFQIWIGIRLSE